MVYYLIKNHTFCNYHIKPICIWYRCTEFTSYIINSLLQWYYDFEGIEGYFIDIFDVSVIVIQAAFIFIICMVLGIWRRLHRFTENSLLLSWLGSHRVWIIKIYQICLNQMWLCGMYEYLTVVFVILNSKFVGYTYKYMYIRLGM